jgi:hypothetical protein
VEYSPMTPMTDDFNPFVPRHRINPFGLILWLDFHVLFVCRKFFVHRIDPKGAILWIEIKSARLNQKLLIRDICPSFMPCRPM